MSLLTMSKSEGLFRVGVSKVDNILLNNSSTMREVEAVTSKFPQEITTDVDKLNNFSLPDITNSSLWYITHLLETVLSS